MKSFFKNSDLYKKALTHRSWLNEHADSEESNERLEFLGDAILEYVVSEIIYEKYPTKEEGFLTALRANIVNTTNLAKVARKLDLGKKLLLSKGEEESGGRENSSLLANTVESFIGAIYLDSGIDTVKKFIIENILHNINEIVNKPLKDSKSRLQEKAQALGYSTPKYVVIKEAGPDHNKSFTVEVQINNKTVASGSGKSKGIAEQSAAQKALNKY